MKTRLDQLTVNQFINLLTGNSSVLLRKGEAVSHKKLSKAVRDVLFEYRSIADPAGARIFLAESERLAKARISLTLFSICNILLTTGDEDKVREILTDSGLRVSGMKSSRLAAEIKSRIARAKDTIKRIETERSKHQDEVPDIRKAFDSQIAALMAHFRFQIDTSTMSASVFAHLIERRNTELKTKLYVLSNN